MNSKTISFGDTVRVRKTDLTTKAGLAELTGSVYGETTPSVTDVDVIGELTEDYAINVYFEDKGQDAWFGADLLEFIDHGEGTEIRLDGVDKKWTRAEDGTWIEESTGEKPVMRRPWWKFWS